MLWHVPWPGLEEVGGGLSMLCKHVTTLLLSYVNELVQLETILFRLRSPLVVTVVSSVAKRPHPQFNFFNQQPGSKIDMAMILIS